MEDKGQFGGKFHDGEARTFLKTTVVYDTVIHRRDRWKVELREIARWLPKIVVHTSCVKVDEHTIVSKFQTLTIPSVKSNFE